MSRIYTITFGATITSAGGDTDWCELTPADDKPIKIRGFIISQNSEVGDAAEEGLQISIIRLPATVTSGNGSSVTPQLMDSGDAAAGFSAEVNGTTVATTNGTAANIGHFGWNIRAPLEIWFPDPQFAPKAKQGEVLVIRQSTTLADDITGFLTVWIEEE